MIDFDYIITNGMPSNDTINTKVNEGWIYMQTINAKLIHPHACDTDKISIFSKYTSNTIKGEICNVK